MGIAPTVLAMVSGGSVAPVTEPQMCAFLQFLPLMIPQVSLQGDQQNLHTIGAVPEKFLGGGADRQDYPIW